MEPVVRCTAPTGSDNPILDGCLFSVRLSISSDTGVGLTYREGRSRRLWVLETTAPFLSLDYDPSPLVGTQEGLHYVRGYFDAEGGMPKNPDSRLYLQFCQKDSTSLEVVLEILGSWEISCGRIHNPSQRVDPDYWRFYVRRRSQERFMRLVGSWHPRKREQIETRMKI